MNENLLTVFNSEHDYEENESDWDSMFVEQFLQCNSGTQRGTTKLRNDSLAVIPESAAPVI